MEAAVRSWGLEDVTLAANGAYRVWRFLRTRQFLAKA